MAGTEQDPAGKSPYSYEKGIDYINQVVEDSPDLPPGVGILIDPSRLIGSAIEKKNPYYIPIGGLRIYGRNQEDVIKIAAKIDPTKFKPHTAAFSLKGREVRTGISEDPQPVKKNSFFTRTAKSARSLGQRAAQGASALGKAVAQGTSALGKGVVRGATAVRKGAAAAAAAAAPVASRIASSTRKGAAAAAAAAGKAGTYVKNKAMSFRKGNTKKAGLSNAEIAARKAKGANTRAARAAAKTNNNVQGFALNNNFANADPPPTRSALNKYKQSRADMTENNVNKEQRNLFANADAPAAPTPERAALAARSAALRARNPGRGTPPRPRPNQQGSFGAKKAPAAQGTYVKGPNGRNIYVDPMNG